MALIISGATVATGMSPVAEEVLRADTIFVPNLTFTDKHTIGNAGQIQVQRYNGDNSLEPKAPGSKFVGANYANTVVDINCNNAFQKEVDVFGVVAASMPIDSMTEATIGVSEDTRVAREKTGIAVLVAGGTDAADTTAITATNVKEILIASRKKLRKKHARANVVLCSADVYAEILEAAGKEYVPAMNDRINLSGQVGYWLGMLIIEATLLDGTSSYKYIDAAGAVQTVSIAAVDFIMYDYNAFSIVDKLVALRAVDSEEFVGSKVQSEIDSGLKVTNADCVLVKKNL